jgi:phthalate 4,5-cis-dihydrodiol dehydrogenase
MSEPRGALPRPLRVGIAGLGVGSAMVLPTVERMAEAELVAAADVRPEARAMFAQQYEGRAYDTVEALCNDPDVDVIWVATPNNMHCEHVVMVAEHGKHVVSEKPMAITIEQAGQMVDAADRNGVKLLVGHTYSLNPGIQAMRRIVQSGELGRVISLANWLYSDWMLKPRMPWEVDETQGGGVVFRHGPHIIDTLRTLGGGMVRSVRASTGSWMPERPCPGNFSAYLEFEDGTPATISYSGYGYFNSSDLVWGIGDRLYSTEDAVQVRQALRKGEFDVEKAKEQLREDTRTGRRDAAPSGNGRSTTGSWFGITVVGCERGNIRQSPEGLIVYDDEGMHEVPVRGAGATGLVELRELYNAINFGVPISHDGRWGMATLEVQLAIMQSGRERREIMLTHQVPAPDAVPEQTL